MRHYKKCDELPRHPKSHAARARRSRTEQRPGRPPTRRLARCCKQSDRWYRRSCARYSQGRAHLKGRRQQRLPPRPAQLRPRRRPLLLQRCEVVTIQQARNVELGELLSVGRATGVHKKQRTAGGHLLV